jgi:phage terminase Nu1 subunit (DNA packaging protein)
VQFPTLNGRQFAELIGMSQASVSGFIRDGMPSENGGRNGRGVQIDPAAAIPWVINHREPAGSQRERLAKEQADKVAMENETRRGRLIDIAIVEEVLMVKAAYLAQAHDAVSGRLAHELAGITDPGLIRTRLLAEMREIRAGVAEHTLRTADAIDRIAQDVEHRDAAAEPDGEPVGGSDAAPAGRKRRARKVAKQ